MYRNRRPQNNSGDDSAMIIILMIVVALIIGGFVWWYVNSSKTTAPAPVQQQQQPNQSSETTTSTTSPSTSSGDADGGKFLGPLDIVGLYRTEALGAYSVRHIYSEYDGPVVRVRRTEGSGSGQEEDFYQKEKNGDLATLSGMTLGNFLGVGSGGVVTTWYDQSKNERHITMRSGYPKIKSDTSLKGDGRYRLEFSNTKMVFNDDDDKEKSISLANYRSLSIIANENIFTGPMANRVMRGTLTDVFFFKSAPKSGVIEVLQMSKYPLRVLNPASDVDVSSRSRISVDPDSLTITVVNNTKGKIGVYMKTPAGTKKVIRENVPGNGETTIIRNVNDIVPGATFYIGNTKDGDPIADVLIPMSVVKGTLTGDFSRKVLYVKNLQPSTAVVNIYAVNANGSVNPTPIHANIKQSNTNTPYSVPSMKMSAKYVMGPTPTVEISRWTAM